MIDLAVKGVAAPAIVTVVTAAQPWLGVPVISWLFSNLVGSIAARMSTALEENIDAIVIQFQDDDRKEDYDNALAKANAAGASPADIQAAFSAIDNLVHLSK